MIKTIKQKILLALNSLGFHRKIYEVNSILDKEYKVLKGSIRNTPDIDDAWLFALSSYAKNIFDIGCNIGQSSLLMLYHENIENIILVDPNSEALSISAENLIRNNLSFKAKFINAFVSKSNESEIDFYTVGAGAAGSKYKSFAKSASKLKLSYKVKTVTIDSLVNKTDIIPDLIKIDVEGAEIDVLNGSIELAKEQFTSFFVEIHSGIELTILENTQMILDWCSENYYTAWYLKNKTKLNLDAIMTRGRYHALLLPKNQSFPDSLKDINQSDPLV